MEGDISVDTDGNRSPENASLKNEPQAPFLSNEADKTSKAGNSLSRSGTTKRHYVKWGVGAHKTKTVDIPKDNRPLHVATQTGSYSTLEDLLANKFDPNEQDDMGKSALHIASKALDTKIMKLLIDYKADVNLPDMLKMTPLHYVLLSGKRNRSKLVVECIQLLIDNKVNINAKEVTGQTALHFAAIRSEETWVDVLIRNGAYFCGKSQDGSSSLYHIIKNCPKSLINCLDMCITGMDGKMNEDKLSMKQTSSKPNSEIMLDYEHLQRNDPDNSTIKNDPTTFFMSILNLKKNNNDPAFQSTVKHIFKHPSTKAYVYYKWFKARWMFYTLILFSHLMYSVLLSTYSVLLYKEICKPEPSPDGLSNFDKLWVEKPCRLKEDKGSPQEENDFTDFSLNVEVALSCWIILIPFTFIFIIKELTKVGQNLSAMKKTHFQPFLKQILHIVDAESFLSWMIICCFCIISFHENPYDKKEFQIKRYQYHVSAYGVFMTWLLMLLMIGRATELGIYVGMLKTVTITFMKFFAAYIFLILSFVLSFFILLEGQHTFANSFPTMIIKVN